MTRTAWIFELSGGAIGDYEDTCLPKEQREAVWTVAALHQWDMGVDDPRCITSAEEVSFSSPSFPLFKLTLTCACGASASVGVRMRVGFELIADEMACSDFVCCVVDARDYWDGCSGRSVPNGMFFLN